jgi:hypothetical protein
MKSNNKFQNFPTISAKLRKKLDAAKKELFKNIYKELREAHAIGNTYRNKAQENNTDYPLFPVS